MQWRQVDHVQTVCTLLQADNHTDTSSLNFYRPDALPKKSMASLRISPSGTNVRKHAHMDGQVQNIMPSAATGWAEALKMHQYFSASEASERF